MSKHITTLALAAVLALTACAGPQKLPTHGVASGFKAAEPISADKLTMLRQKAAAGDVYAAYDLYRATPQMDEKRRWICVAANRELPPAQAELAKLYWPRPGSPPSPFRRDIVKAYVWSHLAVMNDEPMQLNRSRLWQGMSETQRVEAAQMLSDWSPDLELCKAPPF